MSGRSDDGVDMAIAALIEIMNSRTNSKDNSLQALLSLSKYVPHPVAVRALVEVANDRTAYSDHKLAAIKALGGSV